MPSPDMKPSLAQFRILLLATLLWTGCSLQFGKGREEETDKTASVPVERALVGRGPIERVLQATSSLEAEQEVRVLSRSSNRVIELLVEEGDVVAEDQLLVRLENDLQKTSLARAENQEAKAREEFERQDVLYRQDLISDQVHRDLLYDLKGLELSVRDARRELGYTSIEAPIAGTIVRRMVKLGDEITAGQHLFDIIDFDSTVARLYIPERELGILEAGQEVRVTAIAFPGRTFPAHIERISPVIEAGSGMVRVTIAFDDLGPLRPGMSIEAGIVVDTRNDAVLVPKQALTYDGDQQYVFRILPDDTVERLQLDPGLENSLMIEARSGIDEGDAIVIAGQAGLKHGSLVRVIDSEGSEQD